MPPRKKTPHNAHPLAAQDIRGFNLVITAVSRNDVTAEAVRMGLKIEAVVVLDAETCVMRLHGKASKAMKLASDHPEAILEITVASAPVLCDI